jgi:hypothetical protein
MSLALKRRNTPADEASNDVLRRQAGTGEFAHNPVEGIDRSHRVPRIISLVPHLVRRDIDVIQQIDQVHISSVLHVEEGLLPFLT